MDRNFYYALGRPLSPLYSLIMRLREQFYLNGVLASTALDVPVISIGNLTLGGTGKTPLVQHLARLLQRNGFRPAIISRGYGGATKERVNIVSDGNKVLLAASYVGDEPRMLAETLPGVPVLTGVVRKLPAAKAIEMGADVLLLDDGFQHLAIHRDLDLVLFSADELAGNSRVFPGGDLREPVRALYRAHAFVLTGTDESNIARAVGFKTLLQKKFPDRPIFFSGSRAVGLVRQETDGSRTQVQQNELAGRRCLAFCGIARPDGFRKTLTQLAIEPTSFKALPDHHAYKEQTVRQLVQTAEQTHADCLLCTEKDLVKLRGVALKLPLYGVIMQAAPESGLDQLVLHCAARKNQRLPLPEQCV
ncbi:MAG: lipid-A-disaccharide kinase [Candidatus Electronema aureum]|uniref:Tetraacyldisaccharide 4'-kinase n=1 Tax=Candidatus Electronema aureum TaxID=2005002 RepID=A0A521FZY8_9BACT|nr:MAG: lipid-A-disaccharide kinase [Candidatus Electronema aureum]